MITFERFTLDNGLTVIFHREKTTPLVVVNTLFDVGARDAASMIVSIFSCATFSPFIAFVAYLQFNLSNNSSNSLFFVESALTVRL